LGKGLMGDYEPILARVKYELENTFAESENISFQETKKVVDTFIGMFLKKDASIFEYSEQFIQMKRTTFNKYTRRNLSSSAINSYHKAFYFFKEYLESGKIGSHPSMMNDNVLNGFYLYIDKGHNYRVKMHRKVKEFLKYLHEEGKPVHPSYRKSKFAEEYDNQDYEENDRALTVTEIQNLIEFRRKLKNEEVKLPEYKEHPKLKKELQNWQKETREKTIIRSLDCYLFMIGTGQYHYDIMKSKLSINSMNDTRFLSYRRAKNGSLCRSIPILNNEVFITEELINDYNIRSNTNFPFKPFRNWFRKIS
jgi:hypothetical protein